MPTPNALRAKLNVARPAIAMAAHNPLSAKLGSAAGFDAIWGSGFELSASYAVPDASILSMSTHLEMMRAMGEVQGAPIIADIDTGFGNAVNVAYAAPRYPTPGWRRSSLRTRLFPRTEVCAPTGGRSWSRSASFKENCLLRKLRAGERWSSPARRR